MKWAVHWGPVFRQDVKRLHLQAAQDLCAEVLLFAETGRGRVTRRHPHDPQRLCIVVPGAIAYLFADERTGILHAHRAFQR